MIVVTLTITQGDDQGSIIRIFDGDTKFIGRSSKANVVLNDAGISRMHCRIRVENGTAYLFDLSSKNGTFLNGNVITIERTLSEEDEIVLGTTHIRVQITSATEASDLPPVEAPPLELNLDPAPSQQKAAAQEESLMGAFDRYFDQHDTSKKTSPDHPRAVATAFEAPPAATRIAAPLDLSGTLVGGCRVEELLSRTPTRQVYRATQLSMARIVALRVLPPQMANDKAAVERFAQTARDSGRLVHPNIVQVYDAGEDNNIHFIALELVDGQSLQQAILKRSKKQPMDAVEAASITEQIAEALEFAHAQSAIHGNINPENIFVTSHGVAKLADFGLPPSSTGPRPRSSSTNEANILRLCCRAPEQITGKTGASIQSDIYALGVVLFFMLTGRPPFKGLTEKDVTEHILRTKHQDVRTYRKQISEGLVRIIERAMAHAPADRYPYASEMKDDIARFRAKLKS